MKKNISKLTFVFAFLLSIVASAKTDVGGFYAGDATNIQGGLQTGGSYLGAYGINVMLSEPLGWKYGTVYIYGLGTHGERPSLLVGDVQVTSNIEAPVAAFKIHEAWFKQDFLEIQSSLLFGLYDLNSEFYSSDPAALFLNSSFGVGKEFSQTGQNGPSIFPATALALRYRYENNNHFYFQAAAIDAVPGEPDDLYSTKVALREKEGALFIAELGFQDKGDVDGLSEKKYGVGAWQYERKFNHLTATDAAGDPVQVQSNGAYVHASQRLATSTYGFLRYGFASRESNKVQGNASGGLFVRGLMLQRERDDVGLAVTSAIYETTSETAVELTYKFQVSNAIIVQPDVQYVINPSGDSAIKNAYASTLRFRLSF